MPKQSRSSGALSPLKRKSSSITRTKPKAGARASTPEIEEIHPADLFFARAPQEKLDNWDEYMRLRMAQEESLPVHGNSQKTERKDREVAFTSLEGLQTSSPPGPSAPPTRRIARPGPGPSTSRSSASRNYPPPKKTKDEISSSALPIRFSPTPPPVPLGMTGIKKTGLDAIKATLRKPLPLPVPISGLDLLRDENEDKEMALKRKEIDKEAEDTRAAGQKFFDEMRNRPQVVPKHISPVPPSPETSKKLREEASDATLAMRDLMAAYEAEVEPEELSDEEKGYLEGLCDPNDKCPICDKPLPIDYVIDVHPLLPSLNARIRADGKDSIGMMEQLDFCVAHQNAMVIPLGRNAGYPGEIKWQNLWQEIEEPWIRKRIDVMIAKPETSPMFRLYFSDQAREGEDPEWATTYARSTSSDRMTAGYFGDLGRELIKTYLLELVDWGYLPLYEIETRYKPLGPQPFIARVLIPEVATMMIQSRLNYTPPVDSLDFEDASYTQAQKIRKKSMTYGSIAYGNMDSDIGSEVMLDWIRGAKNRKKAVMALRGLEPRNTGAKTKLAKTKSEVIDLSDDLQVELHLPDAAKVRKRKITAVQSARPIPISIDDDEDELEDSDIETIKPSQPSQSTSETPRKRSHHNINIPPTPSPLRNRQPSSTSSIQTYVPNSESRKRKRSRRSRSRSKSQNRNRKRSSQALTPSDSQSLSQSLSQRNSVVSAAPSSGSRSRLERRKANRETAREEKKKQAVESLRVSMSQDSFADEFDDISSQEFARLDAEMAAR